MGLRLSSDFTNSNVSFKLYLTIFCLIGSNVLADPLATLWYGELHISKIGLSGILALELLVNHRVEESLFQ